MQETITGARRQTPSPPAGERDQGRVLLDGNRATSRDEDIKKVCRRRARWLS